MTFLILALLMMFLVFPADASSEASAQVDGARNRAWIVSFTQGS